MPTFPTYQGELPEALNPFNPRHYFLLAYWIFFRPTALRCYLYQADSQLYQTEGGLKNFFASFKLPAYRGLYLIAIVLPFLLSVVVGLPLALAINFIIISLNPGICEADEFWGRAVHKSCNISQMIFQHPMNWVYWQQWLAQAMLIILFSVAFGITVGVAGCVAVGIAFGITVGVAFGATVNVAFWVVVNVAIGVALGVAVNVAGGIRGGVVVGFAGGVAVSFAGVVAEGVTGGIACIVGTLRLQFYFWQLLRFQSHPLGWDELSVLPLPRSVKFIGNQLRKDENIGMRLLSQQMNNEFQRWAAQKSLYLYLHSASQVSPISFFYQSLRHPALAEYVGFPENARQRRWVISTGQMLMAELGLLKPIDKEGDEGILASFVYNLTKPLRILKSTPITKFAKLIYEINYKLTVEKPIELNKWQPLYRELTDYPYGQEIIRSLDTISIFLNYQTLADLATANKYLDWISPAPDADYLRPTVISSLQTLGEIGIEARTYSASTSQQNKLAAIARAIDTIQQLSQTIESSAKLPEKVLLQRIILQWEELLISAGGKEGRLADFRPVVNPYVVGNPVTGQLFVGRDDIMRRFEELWSTPSQLPSIVLYGHRRMGKTSILRNLPDRFGHDQIIDFNMQRVGYVESTGELFYNLALAIYGSLPPDTIPKPDRNQYLTENPFTIFDQEFLKQLHPRPHNQRLIIAIDEFEIIEDLIKTGKVTAEIVGFFRSLIQTYPWFVLVFAGLHTLQEMTQNYWNPLFSSITLIPVSFINPKAATKLITNPAPDFSLDYDKEAMELIYTLTSGQPYLVQLICHNLVTYYNYQRFEENLDRPARFTTQDVKAIIAAREFYRDGNAYFTGVWAQSQETHGQDQIQILQTLSANSLSIDQLANATGQTLIQLQTALNTLIDHDVIYLQDHQYLYKVELMRRWVVAQQ